MKLLDWLNKHLEESFMVVMLVLIACVSMLQVIVRKIPGMSSLTWAVGVLKDMLPDKVKKVVNIVVDVVTMACMFYLGYYSIEVYDNIARSHEISPAMQWPMSFVYFFMIIGFFLGGVRGIQVIVRHIQHFGDRELTTIEQTMADAKKETELAQEGDVK